MSLLKCREIAWPACAFTGPVAFYKDVRMIQVKSRIRFIGLVGAVASAVVLASCGQVASESQTVRALWYGKQVDGSIVQGVTPVVVSADSDDVQSDVVVDLSDMKQSDTGDYWDAAAHSAAVVGTISSAADPREVRIRFDVGESIDGPSAGGLLTVAVWSDLAAARIREDRSMTGTIMPDGGLGPVGGIPAKIRAASAAGITMVAIPKGQRISIDPESRQSVDVIEQGKSLGVEVVEAASVGEAYRLLTDEPASAVDAEPGAVDADLQAMLATRSAETLHVLAKTPVIAGENEARTERVRRSINDAIKYSRAALESGDSIASYAASSEALGVVVSWNAAITAKRDAAEHTVDTVERLRALVGRTTTEIEAGIAAASRKEVAFVEQLPAMVDAMCWGVDALNELRQAERELVSASTPDEVARAASTIAVAKYDGTDRLVTAVDGALLTGKKPLQNESEAWDFIGGYADLLAEAAMANIDYAAEAGKSKGASARDQELSEIAIERWRSLSGQDAVQSSSAVRTAAALSAFVSTSLLVTGIGAVKDLEATAESASKITISLREAFDQQVAVAAGIGLNQARSLEAAQLDPSYSIWGNEWGTLLATQPPTTLIADELRRDGLTYQMYSNVQARMLGALARTS